MGNSRIYGKPVRDAAKESLQWLLRILTLKEFRPNHTSFLSRGGVFTGSKKDLF